MPHSFTGPTGFGTRQTVLASGTTPANIRYLIDTRGFLPDPHAVSGSASSSLGLMIPGSVGSTFPWGDIIKDGIDKLLGLFDSDDPFPHFQQPNGNGGPIVDRPFVPDFIDKLFGGTLPRGATPYIDLADGTVGCQSGYHPEKAGKGYCVRNRRMNALNPRALSRASRRVGGFARAVKRARTLKRICKTL